MSARKEPATVYTNVCVHDGVEITLGYGQKGWDSARILFGAGEEVLLEFIDADSLDRLVAVAARGAVGLRKWIAASRGESGLAEE